MDKRICKVLAYTGAFIIAVTVLTIALYPLALILKKLPYSDILCFIIGLIAGYTAGGKIFEHYLKELEGEYGC